MKKFSLLLLDANVVIKLCEMGLWRHVLPKCEVLMARTVFEESFFYINDSGDRVEFSLEEDFQANRLTIIDVPARQVLAFKARFSEQFAGDLDPGEAESLAYLDAQPDNPLICSADKIVFRILGCIGKGDQGRSLEMILQQCGLTRKLPHEFGEEYRKRWTTDGVTAQLQGRAFKGKR